MHILRNLIRALRPPRAAPPAPDSAAAWYERANTLLREDRLDDAAGAYRRVLERDPRHRDAQFNLATTLIAQGRSTQAESVLRQMIEHGQAAADVLQNLGVTLAAQQRHAEAEECFRQAVATSAPSAALFKDLAFALYFQSRFTEAMAALERACALAPRNADVQRDFANMLYQHGDFGRARSYFRAALELAPLDRDSASRLGSIDLLEGNIQAGWPGYRLLMREALIAQNGGIDIAGTVCADLTGQTVLLLGEQGIGDELIFLRYVPALKRRGATVHYRAESAIAAVLASRPTVIDAIHTLADPLPQRDCTLLIGDLPQLLEASAVPPAIPLHADPARAAAMRERLAACGEPPYIGVTWRAGLAAPPLAHLPPSLAKHIPLPPLANALRGTPGTRIILQRHVEPAEIVELSGLLAHPVHDFSSASEDLEDLLALLSLLDDYVGVSNTNMHLLASLGRRARVLVPCPPDWRWMAAGKRSPWFPGFTIYRQNGDGDWSAAMRELQRDMTAGVAGKPL